MATDCNQTLNRKSRREQSFRDTFRRLSPRPLRLLFNKLAHASRPFDDWWYGQRVGTLIGADLR